MSIQYSTLLSKLKYIITKLPKGKKELFSCTQDKFFRSDYFYTQCLSSSYDFNTTTKETSKNYYKMVEYFTVKYFLEYLWIKLEVHK